MKRLLTSLTVALLACGPAQLVVVMNAQNDSGQSGTATLTDLGAKTRVRVIIHKAEGEDRQPVHLHQGRCGEIGPAVKPPSDNKEASSVGLPDMRDPLEPKLDLDDPPPSDGGIVFTSAVLEKPYKDLTNGDWVINVHDARDFALYVSCGNIN